MAGRKRRKVKLIASKEELEDQQSWSDLPTDLLLEILSRLTLKESTCASAVCKNWFSVVKSVRVLNKSPLLMKIPNSGDVFELYNPSTRKSLYLQLPQMRGCWIYDCCIDGWLLIYQRLTRRVFFFNPYTQVSIELPRFNLVGYTAVFSSSPVSHDCTVIALKTISPTAVAISTCNLTTMNWTTNDYPTQEPTLNEDWTRLILSNGRLYCQSISSWISVYDTRTCTWILNVIPPPRLPPLRGLNRWRLCLVEHKGHIFVIYFCCQERIIFKLDKANGKWEKMKTLGGVILFMGTRGSQARVNLRGMSANNIYFPEVRFYGKYCMHYSLDEGRYYPNKKYSWLQQKKNLSSIWIDPPADDKPFM